MNTPSPQVVFNKNVHIDDVSRMLNVKTHSSDDRYLYVMDEVANEEKFDELVRKQIELDQQVLVFKHGELGSYRSLIQENGRECEVETTTCAKLLSQIRAGPESVDYVCFDEMEGRLQKQNFGFSYVAAMNSDEQRIGFATVSLDGSLQYDPRLNWIVPKNCRSSEDAVKMIYTYALAYKLLVLYPSHCLMDAKTAMINVGTDYSLAEAFIALSLYKNLNVFVTVDSDEDATLITNRFPEIPRGHILRSENCSYIQFKYNLEGRGIDVFVNCLRNIEHVEAALTCLAVSGVYIEVGMDNCHGSNEMGLYPFLKLISVYVMRKEVSDLLELPAETKELMHEFIEECIEKGIMRPLELEHGSMESMNVVNCQLEEEIQSFPGPGIEYDKERSYLIVGTSWEDSSVFELIEWLMKQGSRRFMIALEESSMPSLTMDRMNKISTDFGTHILLSCASELDDEERTATLLEQIDEKLGPLEAVFITGINKAGGKISNLDDLVSPDVYFIGLASACLGEFERRSARGSPSILFHGDELESVISALPRLNQLLAELDNNNAEILYRVRNPKPRSMKVPRFRLRDYFPDNLEMLSRIGEEDETTEPTFVEMSSSSSRYHHCKGVYPIFALPAVHSLTLQPLFQRLQQPVFSATTASMASVKDLAGALYSALNKIQCTGPISLISETWTLPLALELISFAKRDRRQYKIFVLEGIPEIWSDRVARLQSMSPEKLDMVCAEEIFHFVEKPGKRAANTYVSFEAINRELAENVSSDERTVENVIKGARRTRNVIDAVTRFQFPNELLEHVIWFERSRPSERLLKLSVTSELLVLDEPNYRRLLDHPEVSRTINRNTQYSWWEYTKPENVE